MHGCKWLGLRFLYLFINKMYTFQSIFITHIFFTKENRNTTMIDMKIESKIKV